MSNYQLVNINLLIFILTWFDHWEFLMSSVRNNMVYIYLAVKLLVLLLLIRVKRPNIELAGWWVFNLVLYVLERNYTDLHYLLLILRRYKYWESQLVNIYAIKKICNLFGRNTQTRFIWLIILIPWELISFFGHRWWYANFIKLKAVHTTLAFHIFTHKWRS